MNIPLPTSFRLGRSSHESRERASIALIVFILMIMMWGLVLQSSVVLRQFRQELKLVEKSQIERYLAQPLVTNAAPQPLQSSTTTQAHVMVNRQF